MAHKYKSPWPILTATHSETTAAYHWTVMVKTF